MNTFSTEGASHESQDHFLLYRVRQRDPQVAGEMPRLRGVEHHGGAPGGEGPQEGPVRRPGERPGSGPEPPQDHGGGGDHRRAALPHRHGGAGPGAGGRSGAGLPGAGGGRAGHRQVHPHAPDLRPPVPHRQGPLCLRRGVGAADQAAGRAAPGERGGAVPPVRDQSGERHRRGARRLPRRAHRGLHPDPVPRGRDRRPREHQPGEGVHHGPDAAGERGGAHHLRHPT